MDPSLIDSLDFTKAPKVLSDNKNVKLEVNTLILHLLKS